MSGSAVWVAARCAVIAGALLAATGCVRAGPALPSQVIAGARAEGLSLEDPIAVSPATVAEVERALADVTGAEPRLRALREYLYTRSPRPFEYAPHLTLTAERAYSERRG